MGRSTSIAAAPRVCTAVPGIEPLRCVRGRRRRPGRAGLARVGPLACGLALGYHSCSRSHRGQCGLPAAVRADHQPDRGQSTLAHSSRGWTGARTPQALKRVRQSTRRNAILQPRRSAAKTEVKDALAAAAAGDAEAASVAVAEAASALDRAAKVGAIHPNAAARRKSRLMRSVNAALGGEAQAAARSQRQTSKSAQAKAAKARIAAGKASKAKGEQTAAGKARAALSKSSRSTEAASACRGVGGRRPRRPPAPRSRRPARRPRRARPRPARPRPARPRRARPRRARPRPHRPRRPRARRPGRARPAARSPRSGPQPGPARQTRRSSSTGGRRSASDATHARRASRCPSGAGLCPA